MEQYEIKIETKEENEALAQIFDAALKFGGYQIYPALAIIQAKIQTVEK